MSEPTKLISLGNLSTFKDNLDTISLAPLDTRITNVENDLSTDIAIETGNPINFTALSAQKAASTQISMEPIQDLHGYDHPWPARGGKNVLPLTVDIIKSVNQSSTWDGNSTTIKGITYEILTDDGNNVTGIKVNGTTTTGQNSALYIASGTYIQELLNYVGQTVMCSGCPAGGATDGYHLRFARFDNDTLSVRADIGNGVSTTITDFSEKNTYVRIYITAGTTCNNLIFTPQIEIGSQKTTFEPYTNICPIESRTETSLVGCGKNLVEDVIKECNINVSGVITVDSRYDLWIGRVVKGITYTVKSNENSFVGGFFTAKPSAGSTTYDGNRYVPSSYSFTAPITGYVVFRTAHDYDTPQIDIGTQSTVYEPYQSSNDLTIQFGEKVYGATVELEKGTVTVTHKQITYDGDTNKFTAKGGGTSNNYYEILYDADIFGITTSGWVSTETLIANGIINSHAPYGGTEDSNVFRCYINQALNFLSTYQFGSQNSEIDTLEKANQWLATQYANGTPWQVVYKLAEPITIQLTPNEISLLEGVNNILSDADGITLTYRDGKVATLEDVEKLDEKIEQVGQNAFSNVKVGSTTIEADSKTDTLELEAGDNIILTPDVTNDKVTIVAVDTKNTAGSTDTSSKIYLIGATSQAANPQTYSDNEVFVESGLLTTKKLSNGDNCVAVGAGSHAEGNGTSANGEGSHVEGYGTYTEGYYSHAEGGYTFANGAGSHAEGYGTSTIGDYSHAEGASTCASGTSSHAEGYGTTAGDYSHAEGGYAFATANFSHAEGVSTNANKEAAHAEGYYTIADGVYAHSEGWGTAAMGSCSHSEGSSTTVFSSDSHAEGYGTCVTGSAAHAEGNLTTSAGASSHSEGKWTIASGADSHSEGECTCASGQASHAEGYSATSTVYIQAIGMGAHAEGFSGSVGAVAALNYLPIVASGDGSHAEGVHTTASGFASHAEGYGTSAYEASSHAEGSGTIASGQNSHAEGNTNIAQGLASHAEGTKTRATNSFSHAEGTITCASGYGSHAEGQSATSSGDSSHAEGTSTRASGISSHTEGYKTTASTQYSHAEGYCTYVNGNNSHAEGARTTSSGLSSHAEGMHTCAAGEYSHAEGTYTTASCNYSKSLGHYNAVMTTGATATNTTGTAFVIGNGTGISALSNAFSVQFDGTVKAAGTITASTVADYAEYFEWMDENPNAEDRTGYFVTFDTENKIKIATNQDDYILGVVSGAPFVLGNGDCDVWNGMFIRDEFNRIIYEPAPLMIYNEETGKWEQQYDEQGDPLYKGTRPVINPEYDPTIPYINRADRSEWATIGMLGVLAVRDDGTCEVNKYCTVNQNGIATKASNLDMIKYRVIKRNSEDVVEIVFR